MGISHSTVNRSPGGHRKRKLSMACSADGGAAAAAPGPEAAPCLAGPAELVAAGTGAGAGAGAAAVWAGWAGAGCRCGGAKRSRRRRLAAASSAARLPPPSPRPAPCCRLSPRDLPRPRPPAEVPAAARPPQLVVCGPTGAMRLLPRRGTLPPARPGSDSAGGARRRGRASHRCCSAPAAESATIAVGSISTAARVGLSGGRSRGCAHAPVSSAIGTASAIGSLGRSAPARMLGTYSYTLVAPAVPASTRQSWRFCRILPL